MLEQFCEDFLAVMPLQLPELLDKRNMEKPVRYEDYVLLTFTLNNPYPIEEVMDMLEDEMEMIILYHHIPSQQTDFGHSCCAYSILPSDGCLKSMPPPMSGALYAR